MPIGVQWDYLLFESLNPRAVDSAAHGIGQQSLSSFQELVNLVTPPSPMFLALLYELGSLLVWLLLWVFCLLLVILFSWQTK